MTAVQLPLLPAVVIAGLAYLVGHLVARRVSWLRHYYLPEPLLGGLIFAFLFLALRGAGLRVEIPTQGYPVDFLVALLTTNMGLHITPKIFREGYKLFFVFLGLGIALYFIQLVLVLPVAFLGDEPLRTAIVAGPLSFVGAPYNLNPPSQTGPIADLFRTMPVALEPLAQGVMMIGVIAAILGVGLFGQLLFRRAGEDPPKTSLEDRDKRMALSSFATEETELLILTLFLIALAFGLQQFLLSQIPWMRDDYLPVILISYLLGAACRLSFERFIGPERFPEDTLTILLLGPTMSLVFAYAAMSIPLHHLAHLTPRLLAGAILAIGGSVALAWLAFPLFARFTNRYYACVIATAFLAVTTGWGPIGMGFLRQFMDEEGPVEPMPVIMPMNAFYIFPWMVILVTRLIVGLFG